MGVEVAEPARAAHAELAVALGVAVAEGDRVEVVPDPQQVRRLAGADEARHARVGVLGGGGRSEEHTSELQSLMRISYAVFCLKKKKKQANTNTLNNILTQYVYN